MALGRVANDSNVLDGKRRNFVGIQLGSAMAAEGYETTGLQTGNEAVVAHKTGPNHATVAEDDGVVTAIEAGYVEVTYGTGKSAFVKRYTTGRQFGRHEGTVFPHDIVANVKLKQKVAKGAVLTYNEAFFEPSIIDPTQVLWKAGVMATVALLEGIDTLDDSSACSIELSKKLGAKTTKVEHIRLRFDQAIHDLVKEGETVDIDTVLCTIEDALTASTAAFKEESRNVLSQIESLSPRAGGSGTIDRIEIFYNGELEDATESVAALIKAGDRRRKKEAQADPLSADNGRVTSAFRVEGIPVELNTVLIRLYITKVSEAIGGDKVVFANQMKSTFRRRMTGINMTESGIPLDAYFGSKSIDERIVESAKIIAVTNVCTRLEAEKCQAIYRKGG